MLTLEEQRALAIKFYNAADEVGADMMGIICRNPEKKEYALKIIKKGGEGEAEIELSTEVDYTPEQLWGIVIELLRITVATMEEFRCRQALLKKGKD